MSFLFDVVFMIVMIVFFWIAQILLDRLIALNIYLTLNQFDHFVSINHLDKFKSY
jgi:hypothetical protein